MQWGPSLLWIIVPLRSVYRNVIINNKYFAHLCAVGVPEFLKPETKCSMIQKAFKSGRSTSWGHDGSLTSVQGWVELRLQIGYFDRGIISGARIIHRSMVNIFAACRDLLVINRQYSCLD